MCMQRKPHHPAHTHTDTDHVQQKVNAYIKHFKLSWNNDHHHCHHFIILEMADSVKLSLSQHPFFFCISETTIFTRTKGCVYTLFSIRIPFLSCTNATNTTHLHFAPSQTAIGSFRRISSMRIKCIRFEISATYKMSTK